LGTATEAKTRPGFPGEKNGANLLLVACCNQSSELIRHDPVANVGYTLDTQNKIAHRFAYSVLPGRQIGSGSGGGAGGGFGGPAGILGNSVPPPPSSNAALPAQTALRLSQGFGDGTFPAMAPAVPSDRPRPEITHQDLGTRMIEGVMAKGQGFVQTWPTGSQGNDRPFQITSETWMSPDLNLLVLSKNVDPRTGENSMKLINISRAEPPSTLFAPPPDYTVVDETGPFEIKWTGSRRQ